MPIDFTLRHAEREDALCISGLATQVFLDTYATDGMRSDLAEEALSVYAPEQFRQRLEDPNRTLLLAERNGHLLGFAEFTRQARPPLAALADAVELVRLYVQRHAHRQGVGQALLQQVERLVQASDTPCLWLAVWAENHRAQAFYQALGYACVGNTAYEFGGNAYANQVFCKRW
ncbi:GNAT family N-acetyltransferase [Pseudomonas sp. Au-Pse12]|uniref:GNAT family N-acetyltransferase n=1 Tax=Pseudomonas sp. Au-Pse12 TaxID=2906459 RepID=UPI001E42BD27|nr:GNAT family N-acetyltransferase [Pseudomonas sp. Au-Pse12]MCE4055601.1 GNAT family N-acetyltransferase [Pseudomonas sp. Au-Pse12]